MESKDLLIKIEKEIENENIDYYIIYIFFNNIFDDLKLDTNNNIYSNLLCLMKAFIDMINLYNKSHYYLKKIEEE